MKKNKLKSQFLPRGPLATLNQRSKAPLAVDERRNVKLAALSALSAMTLGHGTRIHWNTLALALNVAMVLCELGVRPQGAQVTESAQQALIDIHMRSSLSHVWNLGLHEFIISSAIRLFEFQLDECSKAQLLGAVEEVWKRNKEAQLCNNT